MCGWESKPRHQQPPPMQILVYKGHWCKIVFRQLWFGAWRLSELGTIQRRYWHLPLYSDVQGEVLFGQFLVLIWPWLHINSDKHHFLCSHFIGLFLISIFPGCFLWGCPRRSLGTWTSGWRRHGATKCSSKAIKPWDPGWRRRWGRPHVPADVKWYSALYLYLSWLMLQQPAVLENLKLNLAVNENMFDSAFRPERSKTYLVFHFAYPCQEYFMMKYFDISIWYNIYA